jgi:hypothetical protein
MSVTHSRPAATVTRSPVVALRVAASARIRAARPSRIDGEGATSRVTESMKWLSSMR